MFKGTIFNTGKVEAKPYTDNITNNLMPKSTIINDYDDDELEEIMTQEEVVPAAPTPPTAEDLLKQWFNKLCDEVSTIKTVQYNNYHYFGTNETKEEFPQLYFYDNHPNKIKYKEYEVVLESEEAIKLSRRFKKGLDAYYANFFRRKIEDMDYVPSRRTHSYNGYRLK